MRLQFLRTDCRKYFATSRVHNLNFGMKVSSLAVTSTFPQHLDGDTILTITSTGQQQTSFFLLLNAYYYRKFPAESGNNVLLSVRAFVHTKVGISHFS